MDATLSRGSTEVSIPILGEAQDPVVNVDFGKPEIQIQQTGASDPRAMDQWSGVEQYTILGKLTSANAHQNAINIAELIKAYSGGDPLLLNIPMAEFDTDIEVAPAAGQDESLSMTYPAGKSNRVDLDLALTRVGNTFGSGTQPISTPTEDPTDDQGNPVEPGPIQLINGSNVVDLTSDVEVSRSVGRPQSSVSRSTDTYPNYYDKRKAAYEAFELSFEFVDNATSRITTLINNIFKPKSGRSGIQLAFNGLFGYGTFDVVPDGSRAIRFQRVSSEQGISKVPTINLRRILTN